MTFRDECAPFIYVIHTVRKQNVPIRVLDRTKMFPLTTTAISEIENTIAMIDGIFLSALSPIL